MISSDQAMQELIEGNCRFSLGHREAEEQSAASTSKTALCSTPLAVILCCTGLDIQIQTIFDQSAESLVTIRAQTSPPGAEAIRAVESAMLQHNINLIIVLGCHKSLAGNASSGGRASVDVESTVAICRAVAQLRSSQAKLVGAAQHKGTLIAGALYNPLNGRVEFIT